MSRRRAPVAWLLLSVGGLGLAPGCAQVLGIKAVPDSLSDAGADDAGPNDGADDNDGRTRESGTEAQAPAAVAMFQFIVNGAPLAETCATEPFNFSQAKAGTAAIKNVGGVPIAFVARQEWQLGVQYPPGVSTGGVGELTGVLEPGQSIDITTVYTNGIIAVLGSSAPFLGPDAGAKVDEGVIPWPNGVPGSEGANEMQVIEIVGSAYPCGQAVQTYW